MTSACSLLLVMWIFVKACLQISVCWEATRVYFLQLFVCWKLCLQILFEWSLGITHAFVLDYFVIRGYLCLLFCSCLHVGYYPCFVLVCGCLLSGNYPCILFAVVCLLGTTHAFVLNCFVFRSYLYLLFCSYLLVGYHPCCEFVYWTTIG